MTDSNVSRVKAWWLLLLNWKIILKNKNKHKIKTNRRKYKV